MARTRQSMPWGPTVGLCLEAWDYPWDGLVFLFASNPCRRDRGGGARSVPTDAGGTGDGVCSHSRRGGEVRGGGWGGQVRGIEDTEIERNVFCRLLPA